MKKFMFAAIAAMVMVVPRYTALLLENHLACFPRPYNRLDTYIHTLFSSFIPPINLATHHL